MSRERPLRIAHFVPSEPYDKVPLFTSTRKLLTERQELEYLTDASVITPQQLASFLTQLPQQTVLHAPLTTPELTPAPTGIRVPSPPIQPLTERFQATPINEKASPFVHPAPSPGPPPPAYASSASVATASALYEYHPTDQGDLAIQPNDRIFITEFMNADWAKGRNERTGLEGIFPRSYVAIVDEKTRMAPPAPPSAPGSYGNMPLEVSQGGAGPVAGKPSKFEEHGKKFGKKLGNASKYTLHLFTITLSRIALTYGSNLRRRSNNGFKGRQRPLLVTFHIAQIRIISDLLKLTKSGGLAGRCSQRLRMWTKRWLLF